jgi:hypothetical protein
MMMDASSDIERLQQMLVHGGEQAFGIIPKALANVITEEQWRDRLDKHGKPFRSCRKQPEVQKLVKGAVDDQSASRSNATRSPGRGTAYRLKRLKRDCPDLYEKVIAGELSTSAAAIAAGILKPPTPLADLRRAWNKASEEERTTFRESICG